MVPVDELKLRKEDSKVEAAGCILTPVTTLSTGDRILISFHSHLLLSELITETRGKTEANGCSMASATASSTGDNILAVNQSKLNSSKTKGTVDVKLHRSNFDCQIIEYYCI